MIQRFLVTIAVFSTLTCGALLRLPNLTPSDSSNLATRLAVLAEGQQLTSQAYNNLQRLPSYRLESQLMLRDPSGTELTQRVIHTYDEWGNIHTVVLLPTGLPVEMYYINGNTYVYREASQGWIDLGAISPMAAQHQDYLPPVGLLDGVAAPVAVLTQVGLTPIETGRESLNGRVVTHYRLTALTADLVQQMGHDVTDPTHNVNGSLWIDDRTGALLQAEFSFNSDDRGQQSYRLEVSDIGQVTAFTIPTPLVDPEINVAATATAQAMLALDVSMDYNGQALNFILTPVSVASFSPTQAEMLVLVSPPPAIETESFLEVLRGNLRLSLPTQNLVVTSTGFRLDSRESQLSVYYTFDVDLTGLDRVELLVAGRGNPLLAPVIVEAP